MISSRFYYYKISYPILTSDYQSKEIIKKFGFIICSDRELHLGDHSILKHVEPKLPSFHEFDYSKVTYPLLEEIGEKSLKNFLPFCGRLHKVLIIGDVVNVDCP